MGLLIREDVNLVRSIFLVRKSKFFGCWVGFFPHPQQNNIKKGGVFGKKGNSGGITLEDDSAGNFYIKGFSSNKLFHINHACATESACRRQKFGKIFLKDTFLLSGEGQGMIRNGG